MEGRLIAHTTVPIVRLTGKHIRSLASRSYENPDVCLNSDCTKERKKDGYCYDRKSIILPLSMKLK